MWRDISKIFLIVFHIALLPALCKGANNLIIKGDSLYNQSKWTEAYNSYLNLFDASQTYTPNMLLKMAYISGKNGDLANQLYYLCTLYRHHPSKKVLKKIEAISDEYGLQGYRYSDIEYFISVYKQHYDSILIALIIISLVFCSNLIWKKWKNQKLSFRPIVFLLFLAFLYFVSNYSLIPPRAIINKNYCLIMEEPSAGSDIKTIVNKGHRITLFGKQDIWYLVNWEGNRYYIKETDLYIIPESHPYLF